jgi:hypothetical protein
VEILYGAVPTPIRSATAYSAGTISVTLGDATVTGSGTTWTTNAQAGQYLVAPNGAILQILSVTSNTELELTANYAGPTIAGQTYAIGWPINVPDIYEQAIKEFVLSQAYGENTDRQDLAKANDHERQWKQLLGLSSQSQVAVSPKVGAQGGSA